MNESEHQRRALPSAEVVRHVKRGDRVFVQGAAATPSALLDALVDRVDLAGVRLYHLHLEGAARLFETGVDERMRSVSFFTGPAARGAIERGHAEYMPVFLSDIPGLFQNRQIPLDVAMVQLSPPDRHGNATLGTSCDAARAAVDSARIVIAEINELMPRTHGATVVPMSRVTSHCWTRRPLPSHEAAPVGPVEARIGESIAELIEDGSTLQVGIGAIPDAVLARLADKNDLGVHTEMFSDGLLPLLRRGVVSNTKKAVHPGRTVTSFVTGSRELFDYVDGNQLIEFHPCDRTNDTALIRKNDRVVAINSALEIDLTGQVCADSMGHRIYSGIGGQMDFIRGAAMSRGGKPIIALASTAVNGTVSRIVPALKPGAGVVTTRGHVHWVATEYGVRNLHGLTLRERAEALVSLAHPDFRSELRAVMRALRHYDLGG